MRLKENRMTVPKHYQQYAMRCLEEARASHRTKTPDEKVAINPIPIANDVLGCLCPDVGLGV
jgi:hypothetical protein